MKTGRHFAGDKRQGALCRRGLDNGPGRRGLLLTSDGWRLTVLLAVVCLLWGAARADFGYDDSPPFELNLLSFPVGGAYDHADSRSFPLDLYPVNRAWADSDAFGYDWLANCDPATGPARPLLEPGPAGTLKQWDGDSWVEPFDPLPAAGDMVFVINHGWNGSPEEGTGPKTLAPVIHAKLPDAFIYCWDWREGANPNGKDIVADIGLLGRCVLGIHSCVLGSSELVSEIETSRQNAKAAGKALGDTLVQLEILPGVQHLHLIGHSFGGVVCAEAGKILYARADKTPVDQITTLDTPALLVPYAIEAVDPKYFQRTEVIFYSAAEAWMRIATGGPCPKPDASTLNLRLAVTQNPGVLHMAVVDWYAESVNRLAECGDGRYGFGWSVALQPDYDAMNSDLPTGSYWEYPVGIGDKGCIYSWEDIKQAVQTTVTVAKEEFESAAAWVGNQAVAAIDRTKQGVKAVVRLSVVPVLLAESDLTTAAAPPPDEPQPEAAYIYKTLSVPLTATSLTFDYRFEAVSRGDILTLSVDDKVLVVLDAEAEGVSETYQHAVPVNVTAWAGQEVVLQIALQPAGGGESAVLIDNITFFARTIPGDMDGDLYVGLSDVVIMADQWLIIGPETVADIQPEEGDGRVDLLDFSAMSENWQIDLRAPNGL